MRVSGGRFERGPVGRHFVGQVFTGSEPGVDRGFRPAETTGAAAPSREFSTRDQQPGEVPEWEPVRMPRRHHQRIRAVAPDVLLAAAGVGPGQRAQHQPPRHEAGCGVGFAGPDQGLDLVDEAYSGRRA